MVCWWYYQAVGVSSVGMSLPVGMSYIGHSGEEMTRVQRRGLITICMLLRLPGGWGLFGCDVSFRWEVLHWSFSEYQLGSLIGHKQSGFHCALSMSTIVWG